MIHMYLAYIYIIHMIHMIHSNNDYRHMIHMYLVSTLIVVLESPMEIRLKWDHHSGWKKNNNSHGAQPPGTPTRLTLAAASTGGGARLTRGHQGCLGDMDECWRHKKSCPHIIYHNHLLSIENLSETYCIQIYPTLFIYAWSSWSQMSLSRISQLDAEKKPCGGHFCRSLWHTCTKRCWETPASTVAGQIEWDNLG